MELDEIGIFDLHNPPTFPLTPEKRELIERRIVENVADFGKSPGFRWAQKPNQEFLQVTIDPVVLELTFQQHRVELFGTAPAWAKLLFTKGRREQLTQTTETVLNEAGFQVSRAQPAKPEPRGWAARRADKSNA